MKVFSSLALQLALQLVVPQTSSTAAAAEAEVAEVTHDSHSFAAAAAAIEELTPGHHAEDESTAIQELLLELKDKAGGKDERIDDESVLIHELAGGAWNAGTALPAEHTDASQVAAESAAPAQCSDDQYKLKVEIQTDRWASETSWQLQDRTGDCLIPGLDGVLAKGGGYRNQVGGRLIEEEVCADKASSPFKFVIRDSAKDGICCSHGEGYYKITLDGEIVVDEVGNFGKENVHLIGSGAPYTGPEDDACRAYAWNLILDESTTTQSEFADKQLCHTETLAKNGLASIRAINPKGTLASELWAAERLVQTLGCNNHDAAGTAICQTLSHLAAIVAGMASPGAATQVPSSKFTKASAKSTKVMSMSTAPKAEKEMSAKAGKKASDKAMSISKAKKVMSEMYLNL